MNTVLQQIEEKDTGRGLFHMVLRKGIFLNMVLPLKEKKVLIGSDAM